MLTIAEAKAFLRSNFESGVDCPCCGQLVKQYRRKLNAGMARILIEINKITEIKRPPENWLEVVKETTKAGLNAQSMEYSKLKYWGLLEQKTESDRVGARSGGMWRITPFGKLFVKGIMKVPSYIVIYDGKLSKREGELMSIKDALGSHFDYDEVTSRKSNNNRINN